MSEANVRQIIGQAVTDREFRDLLFNNPDAALAGHELTEDEVRNLRGLSRSTFDAVASELEERISRAGVGGVGTGPGVPGGPGPLDLGRFGYVSNCN